jgi:hypothetical protein
MWCYPDTRFAIFEDKTITHSVIDNKMQYLIDFLIHELSCVSRALFSVCSIEGTYTSSIIGNPTYAMLA